MFKGRSLKEISVNRVLLGLTRRLFAFPHMFAWNFSSHAKRNREALRSFKDIHQGKRCVLIANGPSLAKTNLDLVASEVTFGLNRIYLNYHRMAFQPSYLVCINKPILEQFASDFNSQPMTKFFNWRCRRLFDNAPETRFVEQNFFSGDFSTDIFRSLTPAATVTYAALQIIYYMGFSKVYIVGMDHSYSTLKKPNTKEIKVDEADSDHFVPNYFPKGTVWETPDLTASNYYYSVARRIYESTGRSIIDCTVDGKCKVFNKARLEDFFNNQVSLS